MSFKVVIPFNPQNERLRSDLEDYKLCYKLNVQKLQMYLNFISKNSFFSTISTNKFRLSSVIKWGFADRFCAYMVNSICTKIVFLRGYQKLTINHIRLVWQLVEIIEFYILMSWSQRLLLNLDIQDVEIVLVLWF